MPERYYAAAYWGVRPETAAECAEHALVFFERLQRIDPAWEKWCRTGRLRRGTPRITGKVDDRQELEELFRRGRNRANVRRKVDEELGFSILMITPEKHYTMVDIHCGVYTPFSINRCVVHIYEKGATEERLTTASVMTQLLTCMVAAWDPDWGIASSSELHALIPRLSTEQYPVGWLTYCSDRQGRVPPLPAPARLERVKDKGTLITLTDERFTVSNPGHVARAVRVHELLARAGVLTRGKE